MGGARIQKTQIPGYQSLRMVDFSGLFENLAQDGEHESL